MSIPGSMPPLNGAVVETTNDVQLVSLYQKVIQLRDTIVSGQHPVLKAPSFQRQEQVGPIEPSDQSLTATLNGYPPPTERSVSAESYLGKGLENLVKEQIRAKRRRIEETLRPGVDSRGKIAQQKQTTAGHDLIIESELDVADILMAAQLLVPPFSGVLRPLRQASESFDENDYYSSQDNGSSSPSKNKHDAGEADSDAMAISSSDGEISEDEFEPELQPRAPYISQDLPPSLPQWQAPIEPQMLLESEGVDDYEPPAADSPQYEPSPVQTAQPSPQQLIAQFAGPALYPQAISVNQIETPAAPQPSHISPLAAANLTQQLEHSNDQSSRSDQEVVKVSKRSKKKAKKANKASPKGPHNKSQAANSKKRRREMEDEGKRKKRQDLGPQSPPTLVKEEPVTPPTLSQLTPRRQRNQHSYYAEQQDGQIRPISRGAPQVNVPPGYKLVPLDQDDDYKPEYRPPQPHTMPPPPRQYHQPILRDAHGNEFFDAPLQHQPAPSSGVPSLARDGAHDWIGASSQQPRYDFVNAEPSPRAMSYGMAPRIYAEPPRPPLDRPYRVEEHYNPQPEQFRATTSYEPYSRDTYGRVAPLHEIPQPETHPYPHRRPEQRLVEPPPTAEPYVPHEYRPATMHQRPPAYGEYVSVRAQSVHPQAYADPYRHASVAPQAAAGPPMAARAASVYPTRHVSGPLPPQHSSRPGNYPGDENFYTPSWRPPPTYH